MGPEVGFVETKKLLDDVSTFFNEVRELGASTLGSFPPSRWRLQLVEAIREMVKLGPIDPDRGTAAVPHIYIHTENKS